MEYGLTDARAYHFSEVSLLITHYNRSATFKKLLLAFKALGCSFNEIIVSDDGSKPEHLEALKDFSRLYPFTLISSEKNAGLGNNLNKGQAAVSSKFTLYVQEDFVPVASFPAQLKKSLILLKNESELDLIRFYAYVKYPYLKPYKDGFSKMYLPTFALNYMKVFQYSDHPHLRRSSFNAKFGRYAEGEHGDRTEYKMCISFLKNKGKALFYNDYKGLFIQKNTTNEPSMMHREGWKLKDNFFINLLRMTYRQVKYNYDIHFMKTNPNTL